jgi:predicted transcriptional regulator
MYFNMSVNKLLPESVPDDIDRGVQIVELTTDETVFEPLTNDTARQIISILADSPQTASAIAADMQMSLQNVCYHLDRLQTAGLIDAVGRRHSSKGKEMTVYGLITESIVLRLGEHGNPQ